MTGNGKSSPAIKTMLIGDLAAAPYNPRRISNKAMAGLSASIARFGLVQPIVWNERSGNIVGGHQRMKALFAQGEVETTVLVVDLPEGEEKALNVALNSPAISGEFTDGLEDLLDEIEEIEPEIYEALLLDSLNVPCFEPVSEGEQGRLDEKAQVECPGCGHVFTP